MYKNLYNTLNTKKEPRTEWLSSRSKSRQKRKSLNNGDTQLEKLPWVEKQRGGLKWTMPLKALIKLINQGIV